MARELLVTLERWRETTTTRRRFKSALGVLLSLGNCNISRSALAYLGT
ncbi:MAG: hypothetical protein ABSF63_09590 [Candidatus Bathyarchaeia archaeon]